jgi:hypothetical protein
MNLRDWKEDLMSSIYLSFYLNAYLYARPPTDDGRFAKQERMPSAMVGPFMAMLKQTLDHLSTAGTAKVTNLVDGLFR